MALAITLRPTIPDNEARTAFSTLRRLGVALLGLERAVLLLLDEAHAPADALRAVRADESIFNVNTQQVATEIVSEPKPGQVWVATDIPDEVAIAGLGVARRLTQWTLTGMSGPADSQTVQEAVAALLCNPAVQHVVAHA